MPRDPKSVRMLQQFGQRLRAARITAGYNDASEFAAAIGIDSHRYRKNERGESLPHLDALERMSRHLNCTLDWLLLGKSSDRRDTLQ
ncbi:MAG: helix-turn-helix transcriptional regulator [Salinisphaeraceae bacterium]